MSDDLMTAYHDRSDHGRDGVPLHSGPLCNCLELFADHEMSIRADERQEMRAEVEHAKALGRDDRQTAIEAIAERDAAVARIERAEALVEDFRVTAESIRAVTGDFEDGAEYDAAADALHAALATPDVPTDGAPS
jgi:DNA-binding LacI/PurR family transcriptional regulator